MYEVGKSCNKFRVPRSDRVSLRPVDLFRKYAPGKPVPRALQAAQDRADAKTRSLYQRGAVVCDRKAKPWEAIDVAVLPSDVRPDFAETRPLHSDGGGSSEQIGESAVPLPVEGEEEILEEPYSETPVQKPSNENFCDLQSFLQNHCEGGFDDNFLRVDWWNGFQAHVDKYWYVEVAFCVNWTSSDEIAPILELIAIAENGGIAAAKVPRGSIALAWHSVPGEMLWGFMPLAVANYGQAYINVKEADNVNFHICGGSFSHLQQIKDMLPSFSVVSDSCGLPPPSSAYSIAGLTNSSFFAGFATGQSPPEKHTARSGGFPFFYGYFNLIIILLGGVAVTGCTVHSDQQENYEGLPAACHSIPLAQHNIGGGIYVINAPKIHGKISEHSASTGDGHTWKARCDGVQCSCFYDNVERCTCKEDPPRQHKSCCPGTQSR